jgi:hypothetical protein
MKLAVLALAVSFALPAVAFAQDRGTRFAVNGSYREVGGYREDRRGGDRWGGDRWGGGGHRDSFRGSIQYREPGWRVGVSFRSGWGEPYCPPPVVYSPPVVYAPQPVYYAPPVVYQPAPVVYQPQPVYYQPPVVYQPQPVVYSPQPVVYQPAPVVYQPVIYQRPTCYYSAPSYGYYSGSSVSVRFSYRR